MGSVHKLFSGIKSHASSLFSIKGLEGTYLGTKDLQIGLKAVSGALNAAIGPAVAYQASLSAMRAALSSVGDTTKGAVRQAAAFATAVEGQTTYSREAVLGAMKLGATIGGFTGPALDTATQAAIGLSQRLGIGLNQAMNLVSRAAHGQTSALTRYGIVLPKSETAQQKFNTVLKLGVGAFSLAHAQTNTFSGAMAQLKNGLSAALATAFMPLVKALTHVAHWFTGAIQAAKPFITAVGRNLSAALSATIGWLKQAWDWVYKVFGPPLLALQTAEMAYLGALWGVVKSVFSGIGDILSWVGGKFGGLGLTWKKVSTFLEECLLLLAYSIKHWKTTAAIAILGFELGVVRCCNKVVYLFGTVLPAWMDWFAANWKNILLNLALESMTIFKNLAENIGRTFMDLPALISGSMNFSQVWHPLLSGFKSTMVALPKIAARHRGPLENELAAAFKGAKRQYGHGAAQYLARHMQSIHSTLHGTTAVARTAALPKAVPIAVAAGVAAIAHVKHAVKHIHHVAHVDHVAHAKAQHHAAHTSPLAKTSESRFLTGVAVAAKDTPQVELVRQGRQRTRLAQKHLMLTEHLVALTTELVAHRAAAHGIGNVGIGLKNA